MQKKKKKLTLLKFITLLLHQYRLLFTKFLWYLLWTWLREDRCFWNM